MLSSWPRAQASCTKTSDGDVRYLSHDVEFAKPVESGLLVGDRLERLPVQLIHLADRMQPVVDETATLAVDGGGDAAAAVMSDDDNVPHFQHLDGKLQHRQIVGVLGRREVGDVAMDEDLARRQADDLIGGHAAVGAADP